MNNGGGGESSRGTESSLKKRRKNDEFALSLARIAVAQICEIVGLQGFQQSALDTLSDITCKYIQDIGKTSNFYANLAGRTESNVFDIVHGLQDLGLSQGFVGASDINHCLIESGIIKEIYQCIGVSEDVGFPYSIPPFPVIKERESKPGFFHAGETTPVDNIHIPPWLPCFPDPKTYTTPASATIEQTETNQDSVDQDQKVNGPPLLKSKQRLVSNEFQVPFVVEPDQNGGKEQMNNPFLASPLEHGEKEVSLISLPARFLEDDVAQNHSLWEKYVSEVRTFAPVTQGFKSSDLDTDKGIKRVAERRPAVQLKFHTGKKSLASANKHREIANDDSRNDKKMTKEKIMKESFENGKHTEMLQL